MQRPTQQTARSTPIFPRKNDSTSHWIWRRGTVRGSVKLQKDLKELVELFLSRKVEFVVVGGHAVAFHGYPRFTDDLDLWIVPSKENAERILAALREFGFVSAEIDVATLQHPDLGGLKVPFIGRAALIRNKRATGRPQDLADLDHLDPM